MKKTISIFTMIIISAAAVSCSSTKITATWKNGKYAGGPFKKIVVLALFKRLDSRETFEAFIAEELRKSGTDAIPSLSLVTPKQKYSYAAMEALFNKNNIDGIMILRTKGLDKNKKFVQGTNYYEPDVFYNPVSNPYYSFYFNYYTVAYRNISTPGYYVEKDILSIECNLYANSDDTLAWSVMTKTVEPYQTEDGITDPPREAKEFARLILKNLRENGLIK
ncbi:MAG: hypothetical protein MUD12_06990 [Spirochaetes bacterium]|jgi:hypothetical protein|nr:hypothetical protein [Spirochaetota bacterium]